MDVTNKVTVGSTSGEMLVSVRRCICGHKFSPWEFLVSQNPQDEMNECPNCHRRFYFSAEVKVHVVELDN